MQAKISAPQARSLASGQSATASIQVNYNPARLPYYPVHVTAVLRTVLNGTSSLVSHDSYVYFTPYGTAEVWDIVDYGRLRRSWLVGDEATAPARLSIVRADVPVSNIGPEEEAGPQDYIGMRFVDGLAYAVPMRYSSPTNSENGKPQDPLARDGCGFGSRRYRGRIENVRVFTMHNRDGDGVAVPIALKNARVRIMRNVDWGPDITLKEVYTDDQGFMTEYGSRAVEFDHCSINTNSIRVYLSIELIDNPEKVRIKRAWAWYSWTRIETGLQQLNYNNSNRQILNFGTGVGGNREIALDPNDAGRTFTWVKWSKQLLEQELGSAASFSTTLAIKIKDAGEGASYSTFSHNMFIPLDRIHSERTNMHEFGHFAMQEMQRGSWLSASQTGGTHYLERNNKHPNMTITEGFADGFSYLMDEMTFNVLDQESGIDDFGSRYHGRRRTQLTALTSPRNLDLNHAFVSEDILARTMLDLWDGPTNYARFGNTQPATQYNDGGNDNFEMTLTELFKPIYTYLIPDPVRYYNRLLQENTAANANRNVQMRNVWHYNFSDTQYNITDFTILGTDEISGARTITHDRDDYNNLFNDNFTGTSTYSYTYVGTDVTALGAPVGSYNLTTYFVDSYNSVGQYLGRQTINANGAVLSDNLTVQNGAALYLHGSPQPCSFNQSPPPLQQYTKRTDHLNIDILGQARVVVQQGSKVEVGSVSPYQTAVVNLYSGALLSIESGAELKVNAGSTLNFWQGATLLVRNGGSVSIDGDLYIRWGGHICVEEGGNVTLTSSSTLYVDAGAQMGSFPGLGLPATACANKVAACGTVNIQNSGVTNVGGRNEALQFDGNDVVSIPNTNSWVNHSLTQQFAVEAFIRANNLNPPGAQTIFSSRHGSSSSTYGYNGILFTLYGGQLLLQPDGRNYYSSANLLPNDSGCHHVAVTRDNTNRVRFYIDGRETTYSPTTPINAASAGTLNLGADNYSGFGEYFQGMIGEVRVWNFWRSGDQIKQNLTTKLAAPQNGLVAYYDMQDATGSQQLSDLSGVNNTGQNSVSGVLGANTSVGTDDPTWVAQCALACTVQGNFRTVALTWTAPDSTALPLGHRPKVKGKHNFIEALSISPNPATGSATVHFEHTQAGNVRVWVQDLAGAERAVVMQETRLGVGSQNLTLPLHRLQSGLYLVVVQSGGSREHIRLQVN